MDMNCREIVDDMHMGEDGFILMRASDLSKLQSRIGELKGEIESAKVGLKELQKRKGAIEKKLRDDGKVLAAKKEKVLDAIKDGQEWLDSNPEAEAEEIKEKHKEVEGICAPIVSKHYGAGGGGGGGEDGGADEDEAHDEL